MRVRLLGTAAGGAFPQWNCRCVNCQVARTDPVRARPRTQSCVAVSSNGTQWFLINASPDIRHQIDSFPPLLVSPDAKRGTSITGVLLTNADLDHTLGLLSLRESGPLIIHATPSIRRALNEGLNLDAIFNTYCSIDWREPPAIPAPLFSRSGSPCGLRYAAIPIVGKPPRYRPGAAPSIGDAVGYKVMDESSGGILVVIPDLATIDEAVMKEIAGADLLLLDGTFFDDDEMQKTGTGTATAAQMGHLPVGGPAGSLARIAALREVTRVYVHINNTNPILVEDSPERAAVEAAGVVVGYDGMEFSL